MTKKLVVFIVAAFIAVTAFAEVNFTVCVPWFTPGTVAGATYVYDTDYVIHGTPVYYAPPPPLPPPHFHHHFHHHYGPPPPPPPRHFGGHRPPPPPPHGHHRPKFGR